jgi:hypothetical protein
VCGAALAAALTAPARAEEPGHRPPHRELKDSGTDVRFRGLSAVSRNTAWLPHSRSATLAVGHTGTDLTTDAGRTWRTLDTGSYDTVDCTPDLGCWASGEQGRVARLER